MKVPDILLSGNHAKIAAWRLEQRKARTKDRRPDLWKEYLKKQKPDVTSDE
jgi:tRNA (guanine37-N1)-methyltransferase